MTNSISGIFIIFPNTLFKDITKIKKLFNDDLITTIYLVEEPIYFTKFKFHKQKLILHRASMKYYSNYLSKYFNKNKNIQYIEYFNVKTFYKSIFSKKYNIYLYDPIDHSLKNLFLKNCSYLTIYDNPVFLETYNDLLEFKNINQTSYYRHDTFYKWNRTRLNIFLDKNKKPLYGRWTFDDMNKKTFPADYVEPPFKKYSNEKLVKEAIKYVSKHFSSNFGLIELPYLFPITSNDAMKLLKYFLKIKMKTYGSYEEAANSEVIIGSHSFLSSSLNIGLITVKDCLKLTIKQFNKLNSNDKKEQFHNYEKFIRQIIGWRSYVRLLYEFHGQTMYEMNFFNHTNKLNISWFNGTTNIFPIDNLIKKVEKYAYLHHIERLMYIGNFALLSKIDPKEVYKWFMITCIDAYEWVMIPNIHGMSQHALDNSIVSMMSRPYFSSSNYIKRMSNYLDKDFENDWTEIWNTLYYYFIYENIDYLKKNYSIATQVRHWKNKTKKEKQLIINNAEKILYKKNN